MEKDRTLGADALSGTQRVERCANDSLRPPPVESAEECFRLYAGEVSAAVYRLCRSKADAEDVTQEAFLRLHRCLADGEDIENLRAWVHRAARNLVLNQLKVVQQRDRNFEQEVGRALTRLASLSAAVPDELYADQQRRVSLVRALRGLAKDERTLLSERAAGLTFREIARRHGLPHLQRAATKLTAIIRKLRRSVDE